MATTALFACALAGNANAADLVSHRPPSAYVEPPAFTWTGFYLGANAGYGWNTGGGNEYCIDNLGALNGPTCQALPPGVSGTSKGHGALVGGQLGYNWQSGVSSMAWRATSTPLFIRSNTGVNGPFSGIGGGLALPPGVFTSSLDLESLGTFRGRLGYAFIDRLLVYATGGLAYGEAKASSLFTSPVTATNYVGSTEKFRAGWVIGGGLEYALTNSWSVKLEGLYYDLGKITDIGYEVPPTFVPVPYQHNVAFNVNGAIARVGLNYKLDFFAPPVPVVAKY